MQHIIRCWLEVYTFEINSMILMSTSPRRPPFSEVWTTIDEIFICKQSRIYQKKTIFALLFVRFTIHSNHFLLVFNFHLGMQLNKKIKHQQVEISGQMLDHTNKCCEVNLRTNNYDILKDYFISLLRRIFVVFFCCCVHKYVSHISVVQIIMTSG